MHFLHASSYLVPDPKWSTSPPSPPFLSPAATVHVVIKSTSARFLGDATRRPPRLRKLTEGTRATARRVDDDVPSRCSIHCTDTASRS